MFLRWIGFIRNHNGSKCLTLFGSKKYNAIFSRTRYLIRQSGISYVVYHNYGKIKTNSDDNLPVEKTLPLHIFVIL